MTHAQNRHARRINNRKGDPQNVKGQPIEGALSATEFAHKQRRQQRRHKNIERLIGELSNQIVATEADLRILRLRKPDKDECVTAEDIKTLIEGTEKRLKRLNSDFQSAKLKHERLNG